jgi:hypothetical protein
MVTVHLSSSSSPPPPQDAALDPLHILRDQPLAHTLPLASAYAAAAGLPTASEGHRRLKQRLDGVHHEPLFTNINKDFK